MANLFEAAAKGEAAAVGELNRILRRFARQVCRGGGPHGETAIDWEDVAQEAAHRLFTAGLHQYRGVGTENSYMYSLVKTTVIQISRSALRRRRREEVVVSSQAGTDAPHPAGDLDARRIVEALDPSCREIVQRVLLDDETYADLARELGLAESSVRARLSRCLKKARRLAHGGEDS